MRWLVLLLPLAFGGCVRAGFELAGAFDAEGDGRADGAVDAQRDRPTEGAGAPVFGSVTAPACIAAGESAAIEVVASDPSGGALTWQWSAAAGTIEGTGPQVTFHPQGSGPHPCPYAVDVVVTSSASSLSAARTIEVRVRHPEDFDGDGVVDLQDMYAAAQHFGRQDCCAPESGCVGDINGDCSVDSADLTVLIQDFGLLGCPCAPAALKLGTCSSSGWCWYHPQPQGHDLRGVWGSSASDVLAVGELGTVLRFDGSAWAALPPPGKETLRAVWGDAASNYVVVGDGGAVFRFDGTTWSADGTVPTDANLNGVSSCGGRMVVVGEEGVVLSHREGSGWTTETYPGVEPLSAVWCAGAESFVFTSDNGAVFRSMPSGWGPLRPPGESWAAIWGRSLTDLVIAGRDTAPTVSSRIERFDGTAWAPTVVVGGFFHAVWGVGDELLAGGVSSSAPLTAFLVHFRSGAQPDPVDAGLPGGLRAAWGTGATVHFVGDHGTILSRVGQVWLPGGSPRVAVPLAAVWGSGPDELVAVGERRALVRTPGWGWKAHLVESTGYLMDVWGSAMDDVYAVSTGGQVARFDGSAWATDYQASDPLLGVWGSGPGAVVGVGSGVAVHRVGTEWSEVSLGGADLVDVWGRSASEVYAIGDVTLRYDGSSWQPWSVGVSITGLLQGIAGTPDALFIVDSDGRVLRQAADSSWSATEVSPASLSSVWAGSDSWVVAVGAGGTIVRLTASGWVTDAAPTGRGLGGVYGVGPEVVAVGELGTVLIRPQP